MNAFIITDEAHLRAKELAAQMNAVAQAGLQADVQDQPDIEMEAADPMAAKDADMDGAA